MTRPVQLIVVPYDSGRLDERWGVAPRRAIAAHLAGQFPHCDPPVVLIALDGFSTEGTATFGLARRIAAAVRDARSAGAFPLVLAGNCATSLGAVAGMGGERPGVVWLDCHPDFHTAETSRSGLMDGMASAILVGDSWKVAAATVPGFRPVSKERLLFIGARDIEEGERARLVGLAPIVPAAEAESGGVEMAARMGALAEASDAVYLHLDMDVLDPVPQPANTYATPGGLSVDALAGLLRDHAAALPLAAAAVTGYDLTLAGGPALWPDYVRLIGCLADAGAST